MEAWKKVSQPWGAMHHYTHSVAWHSRYRSGLAAKRSIQNRTCTCDICSGGLSTHGGIGANGGFDDPPHCRREVLARLPATQ